MNVKPEEMKLFKKRGTRGHDGGDVEAWGPDLFAMKMPYNKLGHYGTPALTNKLQEYTMDIRAVGLDNTRKGGKGGAQLVVLTLPSGVMSDSKIDPALVKVDEKSKSVNNQTSEMNFVLQQVMYGHAPAASHLLWSLEGLALSHLWLVLVQ